MPRCNIRQKKCLPALPFRLAVVTLLALLAGCSSTARVIPRNWSIPAMANEEPEAPGPKVAVEGTWSMPDATPEDVQRVKEELLRRYAQRTARTSPSEEEPYAGSALQLEDRSERENTPKNQIAIRTPSTTATRFRQRANRSAQQTAEEPLKRRAASTAQEGSSPQEGDRPAPQVVPLAGPLGRLKLLAVAEDAQGRELALLDDGNQRFTLHRGDRLLVPQAPGATGLLWHVEAIRPGALQLRQDKTQRRVLLR